MPDLIETLGCDAVRKAQALFVGGAGFAPMFTNVFYLYRAERPYEITMLFVDKNSDDAIPWIIARDVLVECAVHGNAAGEGDVAIEINNKYDVRPYLFGQTLLIHLSNESEHVHVFVTRQDLIWALQETALVVPLGEESAHFDIDAELEELLRP
jgi:sporulation and cell division protein SsgA